MDNLHLPVDKCRRHPRSNSSRIARNMSATFLRHCRRHPNFKGIPSNRNALAVVVKKMELGLLKMCGMALFIIFSAAGFCSRVTCAKTCEHRTGFIECSPASYYQCLRLVFSINRPEALSITPSKTREC
ncbi:hypothetical protein ACFE04_004649 [Oxalis oulophora]